MQKATILDQKSILIWCFSSVPVSAFWQSKQIQEGWTFPLEVKKRVSILFFVSTEFDELLPSAPWECLLLWKMTEEDLQWRCKEKAASIISKVLLSHSKTFSNPPAWCSWKFLTVWNSEEVHEVNYNGQVLKSLLSQKWLRTLERQNFLRYPQATTPHA